MQCIRLKIGMNSKHHKYYKHAKFRQNPRGDPKFLVDLTWNDPSEEIKSLALAILEVCLSKGIN